MHYVQRMMLEVWMSDILCFSETWLTPKSIIDSHLEVNDFLFSAVIVQKDCTVA